MQPAVQQIFQAFALDRPFLLSPPCLEDFFLEARRHGLLGCLAVQVQKHGHSDRHFAEACRAAYKEEFFKWARYQALLNELEARLEQAHLDAILLKGAALRLTVYRAPGLRPLSDIDLLVRPENQGEVVGVLLAMGMLASPQSNLFSDSQGRTIDLHGPELGRVERGCGLNAEHLWADSRPIKGSRVWRALGPRTGLAHLAVHSLKHSHARLTWLLDIELVSRRTHWTLPEHPAAARALQGAVFLCDTLVGRDHSRAPGPLQRRLLLGMLERDQHPLGQMLLAWHQPRWRDRVRFLWDAGAPQPYETADSLFSRLGRLSWRVLRLLTGHPFVSVGRKSGERPELAAPDGKQATHT